MEKTNLAVVPPEDMSIEDAISWAKKMATDSKTSCENAKLFCERLSGCYQDITDLLKELTAIRSGKHDYEDPVEEVGNIVTTIAEVKEMINNLIHNNNESDESLSIEEVEAEMEKEEEFRAARVEISSETKTFLEKYLKLKAQLGLVTQQEVADLTGLTRQYISVIEKRAHKPQFKTIKRIADAFNVSVNDLIGN